ncbi:MAG: SAM-dependent methyltransferase [Pseudomonadota bacterium]
MTPLTDRAQLERARRRAHGLGLADFLHRAAAAEIEERLSEINRTFTSEVVVSGFPQLWQGLRPNARPHRDEDALDLGAPDLVIHALAMHWMNDPVGQLVQAQRALKPDGLFMGVAFGGETLSVLRAALAEAETRVMGGLSPRVAPMGEIRDLGALLQRAGFSLPVADSVPLDVSYETPLHLLHDLRAMGETNALAARHRRFVPRRLFEEVAALYPIEPDGRILARFDLVFLTGWKTHESQQKPLRPGSAATRLADVLGTHESNPDAES